MPYSDRVLLSIIHLFKDVIMTAIGAFVFIYGFAHAVPLTTISVEYIGIYGAYFGVHVYSSNSFSKQGVTLSEPVQKP